jgi:hypothetical protein
MGSFPVSLTHEPCDPCRFSDPFDPFPMLGDNAHAEKILETKFLTVLSERGLTIMRDEPITEELN